MLEPLLMLTVLNCVFMFSSTMTTCALWWQYRKHRQNCPTHGDPNSKLKVKKTKSVENKNLKTDGKHSANEKTGFACSKSLMKKRDKSDSKPAKDSNKDKKDQLSSNPMKAEPQGISTKTNNEVSKTSEKLTSTEDIRRTDPLPSSDAKSTIVMEVSTVQKIVQVLDNNRDSQQSRRPKGTMTYKISPDNDKKVEIVVKTDSVDEKESKEQ